MFKGTYLLFHGLSLPPNCQNKWVFSADQCLRFDKRPRAALICIYTGPHGQKPPLPKMMSLTENPYHAAFLFTLSVASSLSLSLSLSIYIYIYIYSSLRQRFVAEDFSSFSHPPLLTYKLCFTVHN